MEDKALKDPWKWPVQTPFLPVLLRSDELLVVLEGERGRGREKGQDERGVQGGR